MLPSAVPPPDSLPTPAALLEGGPFLLLDVAVGSADVAVGCADVAVGLTVSDRPGTGGDGAAAAAASALAAFFASRRRGATSASWM